MPDCKKLDPFVTPYVDNALDETNRAALDAHLRVCPPCHSRVAAERQVRDLLRAGKAALQQDCASSALRARCGSLAGARLGAGADARLTPRTMSVTATDAARDVDVARGADGARGVSRTRSRLGPYALAATLLLAAGGVSLYELTDRSMRVMAAELAADHIKCFGLNHVLGTRHTASAVEGSIASAFGWPLHLPDRPERAGLELVGARPCLYGEGRIAHIMYRHNGHPVSLFMLPGLSRPEVLVRALGHDASIWSVGDRTFVLIAREPRVEVERMASFVHAGLR